MVSREPVPSQRFTRNLRDTAALHPKVPKIGLRVGAATFRCLAQPRGCLLRIRIHALASVIALAQFVLRLHMPILRCTLQPLQRLGVAADKTVARLVCQGQPVLGVFVAALRLAEEPGDRRIGTSGLYQ